MLQLFLTSPFLTRSAPGLSSCSYKGMSWWGRTNVSASAKGTVTPCVEFPPAESQGKAPWLRGANGQLRVEMASTNRHTKMHQKFPTEEGKNPSPKSKPCHFGVLVFGRGSLWFYAQSLGKTFAKPVSGVRYCDTKFYMDDILHHLECFKWM